MEIDIDESEASFRSHLYLPKNERLIFSGKFGSGKTYFLKKFFENNSYEFDNIIISPVNYVVGSNSDIFEWIKVDIAKLLCEQFLIDDPNTSFTEPEILSTYLHNNSGRIFLRLLGVAAKYNITIKEILGFNHLYEDEKKLFERFKEFVRNETSGDFKMLANFIDTYTKVTGSIFEDNKVTQLIRSIITAIISSSEKEFVLIIDDLDRLDPDHIFRILNVFCSHNDHFESNKFGFSKVILVCDINNIEHIYRHRYGPLSDFNGYIEKFHTYRPYVFNNTFAVKQFCSQQFLAENLSPKSLTLLKDILTELVKAGEINIRNLKKIYNIPTTQWTFRIDKTLPKNPYYFVVNRDTTTFLDYDIIKILSILTLLVGDCEKLKRHINRFGENIYIDYNYATEIIISGHILSNENYSAYC